MKKETNRNLVICSGIALTLALAFWAPAQSQSAEPAKGRMMMESPMMDGCQAMMEQRAKMMAEMKAQDAELTAQVAAMNRAPEAQKVIQLAAIVTRLVEQRAAMHARMDKMQSEMMPHMMGHMQMGAESMAQCPMMKRMGAESPGTHKQPK